MDSSLEELHFKIQLAGVRVHKKRGYGEASLFGIYPIIPSQVQLCLGEQEIEKTVGPGWSFPTFVL